MASRDKVFDIFELTILIANSLTQHDLSSCCIVNHHWFDTFTPHLWHSITIRHNDRIPKFITPEGQAGLLRNGHHIRILRSSNLQLLAPFVVAGMTCTNLVSLDAQHTMQTSAGRPMGLYRTNAMWLKGRRGSLGTGQVQVSPTAFSSSFGGGGRGAGVGAGGGGGDSQLGKLAPVQASNSTAVQVSASTTPLTSTSTTTTTPSTATSSSGTTVSMLETQGSGSPTINDPQSTMSTSSPITLVSGSTFATPSGVLHPSTAGFGSTGFGTAPTAAGIGSVVTTTGFGTTVAAAGSDTTVAAPGIGNGTVATGFGAAPVTNAPLTTFGLDLDSRRARFDGARNYVSKYQAEMFKSIESILISILKRNPQLQYLVVPLHCLNSIPVVEFVESSLLSLEEFYSPSDLSISGRPSTRFKLYEVPLVRSPRGFLLSDTVEGYFVSVQGAALSHPVLGCYQRARRLQQDIAARINHDSLRKIERATSRVQQKFTHLEIESGYSNTISQILNAACTLTTIILSSDSGQNWILHNTVKDAFLKHAPTLECLEVQGNRFEPETLLALLRSSPSLRTVQTMKSNFGERPSVEGELDVVEAIEIPWACTLMENFECRITNVPRPDIIDTLIEDTEHWIPDPATQDPPQPAALQESHTLQRAMLKQLGRLTHLQKLCLGAIGRDWDNPEYYQLQIQGIRTMVVDEFIQRSCLELSLESGLDELAGLKQLEELEVHQMAHRIGLREVQWMVEQWPKLKAIRGLRYTCCDSEIRWPSTQESLSVLETWEPEHVMWIIESRPDIHLS